MRDDVVEHLSSVYIFEQHVPVVGGLDDIFHPADVRMIQQANDSSLSGSPDLF
jgi:hypothetical protein